MKLNAADKPSMHADTPVIQAITAVIQAVTPVRGTIAREAAELNLHRIYRATPFAKLINLAHLIMSLCFTQVHDVADAAWRGAREKALPPDARRGRT